MAGRAGGPASEKKWEVDRILVGPYEDELKKRVYLCEVRKSDYWNHEEIVEEDWKEIEERQINTCTIRGFHKGSTKVALCPRPPKRQRDTGGAQASRGVGTYASHDRVLHGVNYVTLTLGRTPDFYEQNCHHEGAYCETEAPSVRCALMAWDEVVQPGSCLELRDGGYLFVQKVKFRATDGEVEDNSIVFHGLKLKAVASFLKCDGSDAERELGGAAVVADGAPITAKLADAEALVPAVPAAFWEDGDVFDGKIQWLGHLVDYIPGAGSMQVAALSQSAMARYGWASLSFSTQNDYFCTVHSRFLKKFDAWLRMRVTTKAAVVTETVVAFDSVPPAWIYWVLGKAWFVKHKHQARYSPDTRLHEFAGSTAHFERVFRRDIGKRIDYTEDVAASIAEAPGHPAVTFRFSMQRPGKLLVLFGGLRKHLANRITWDTAKNLKLVKDTFRLCPICFVDVLEADSADDEPPDP